jgi:hypothetical protein
MHVPQLSFTLLRSIRCKKSVPIPSQNGILRPPSSHIGQLSMGVRTYTARPSSAIVRRHLGPRSLARIRRAPRLTTYTTGSNKAPPSLMMTEANPTHTGSKLKRMRGAALKVGQFLIIQGPLIARSHTAYERNSLELCRHCNTCSPNN